jgi:hypothetical protein
MDYGSGLPYTLLSLEEYARTMQLDPLQFRGAVTSLRAQNQCSDLWHEYDWQDGGKVSRQELLYAIAAAEEEIAQVLGYWMAPRWIADEKQDYTQFYQREFRGRFGYNIRGEYKGLQTQWGYVLYGGQRATTQIDAVNIVRSSNIDTTGDTFEDMAVFTVTVPAVLTNPCELKAYFKVYDAADAANCRTEPSSVGADEYWEIRDTRIKLSGTTATVYIPIWQIIKPQLQREIDVGSIDGDNAASYVDTLEFYRVYNDPSAPVQFLWTNESSCEDEACAWKTQAGCMRVRNARVGHVDVLPGTWDTTTSTFEESYFSTGIEPNKVRLWYYAGYENPYARGCDKLSTFWKRQIARLASTRLNRPVCNCENVEQTIRRWQEDMAQANQTRTYVADGIMNNPFGTRVGEVETWNAIVKQIGLRKGKRIMA